MRHVEVIVPQGEGEEIVEKLKEKKLKEVSYTSSGENDRVEIILPANKTSSLVDFLTKNLKVLQKGRIIISPINAVLPSIEEESDFEAQRISREELYEGIRKGTDITQSYVLLMLLSSLIVTIGLLADSPAVVIGAMLLAPLMGPILGTAFGTVIGDSELFKRGIFAEAMGLFLALIFAMTITLFVPFSSTTPEILGRTQPTILDLMVAGSAGVAAAYGLGSGLDIAAGVAVAIALLPPAAVVGITVALHRLDLAAVSFLLLLTNIFGINVAATVTFWLLGFKPETWYKKKKAEESLVSRLKTVAVIILLLTIPLGKLTSDLYVDFAINSKVEKVAQNVMESYPDTELKETRVEFRGERLDVYIEVVTSRDVHISVDEVGRQLRHVIERPVDVTLEIIRADRVEATYE